MSEYINWTLLAGGPRDDHHRSIHAHRLTRVATTPAAVVVSGTESKEQP